MPAIALGVPIRACKACWATIVQAPRPLARIVAMGAMAVAYGVLVGYALLVQHGRLYGLATTG